MRQWLWLLLLPAALMGCYRTPSAGGGNGKIQVFVSILPQKYFVERIGGEHVTADALVGQGQSPHTFELTPQQMARLSDSRVYFAIGFPFEQQVIRKLAGVQKGLEIVDTSAGIQRRTARAEEAGPPGSDGHPGEEESDMHTWLSPKLAKTEAKIMCDTLQRLDPAHADEYAANFAALAGDLDKLDAKLAESLKPLKGREFFVFHPAFGYFADAYDLRQTPVEMGGKEPGAKHLASLIERARSEHVKVIFVQPQFPRAGAEALAKAIDGVVEPMDDLAYDYLKNLESIADRIRAALGAGGAG